MQSPEKTTVKPPTKRLSTLVSVLILVDLSFGSCIVFMPYTMQQMGTLGWFIYATVLILILSLCTSMLSEACLYVMGKGKWSSTDIVRYPYSIVAEYTYGNAFRNVVTVTLVIGYTSTTCACIALAATIMAQCIPVHLLYYTQVRMWTIVSSVAVYPFMMLGTYKDMKKSALAAFALSTISMFGVFVLSGITYSVNGIQKNKYSGSSISNFVIASGDITYAGDGIAFVVPNVVVLADSPAANFNIAYFITYVIFMLTALIPFVVFGDKVQPSIVKTMYAFLETSGDEILGYREILVAVQVSLAFHLLLVAVLSINPAFLSLEHLLEIPNEFNGRRVLMRTSVLSFITSVCFAFPYIVPLTSMIGGVPLNLTCMIFPILIYWKLFETSFVMKLIMAAILIFAFVLMTGITVFSIGNIVENYQKSSTQHLM